MWRFMYLLVCLDKLGIERFLCSVSLYLRPIFIIGEVSCYSLELGNRSMIMDSKGGSYSSIILLTGQSTA